jgi:hypothetical protein
MDPITFRLDDLEERLAALEGTVRRLVRPPAPPELPSLAPSPTPDVAPRPAPTPAKPAATAPKRTAEVPPRPLAPATWRAHTPARTPGDLERWLGGVLLARVGICAVILGAAYFAQLAYRHVPDAFKVLSLYGLAAALLAAGHLLRAKAAARYVGVLQGGAVAIAYVAGLAATLRYHLVGQEVGLLLLAGAAALGVWLARRLQVEALAAVSAIGALAAPTLLGLVQETHVLVLALLLGANTFAAWAEQRWGWRATRVVVFGGAAVLGASWFGWAHAWDAVDRFWGLHGMLLALLAPEVLSVARGRAPERWMGPLASVALALLLLVHVGVESFGSFGGASRFVGSSLVAASGWFALALGLGTVGRVPPAASFVRSLARIAGMALPLAVAALWQERAEVPVRVVALGLLAPVLLLARRRVDVGELATCAVALVGWSVVSEEAGRFTGAGSSLLTPTLALGLLALSLVGPFTLACVARTAPGRVAGAIVGHGMLLTAFGALTVDSPAWWLPTWAACAAWSVAVAGAARVKQDRALAGTASVTLLLFGLGWCATSLVAMRAPGWNGALDPHTLAAVLVAAGAWGVRRLLAGTSLVDDEAHATLVTVALGCLALAGGREVHLVTRGMEGAWSPVLLSVYVTLVAATLLVAGFLRNVRGLRLAALLLFAGVIAKVGLYDLAAARLELRVLVTLVLGLTLLASAFAYVRTARREGDDAGREAGAA